MMFHNINFSTKKAATAGGVILAVIACTVLGLRIRADKGTQKDIPAYDYNETEQVLAEEVKGYLAQYMSLPEQASNAMADAAVQNYNIVVKSGTDVINDEITDAVRKRIRSVISALSDNPEQLTDDTLDGLSTGVTEIIWNAVLQQLSQNEAAISEEYREEYEKLARSLQEQIDALKERKEKISIQANITGNTEKDITSDELFASIENLSDEELKALAGRLGISAEQFRERWEAAINQSDKSIKELEDAMNEMRRELEKEISSSAGKAGTAGKAGEKGEKGEKGAAGADGAAGNDGKTTYTAYADDAYGSGFSLTPTETSKYIGTCISSDKQQPQDYKMYSSWQEYRTYIITSTTDPDTGITTVHIN